MRRFDGVLFDWMLTLAHYPSPRGHVVAALQEIGRPSDARAVDAVLAALTTAAADPDVVAAEAIEDTSPAAHQHHADLLHERAGVDAELAGQWYRLLGTPAFHPAYPDAGGVLERLHGAGMRVGVVSDIHVDLRRHAAVFGFAHCIDAWALSHELGVQKPDPRLFEYALGQLGIAPDRTLMVGDRASRDGAAAALGITCLILPAPPTFGVRGLDTVLHTVGLA